MSFTNSPLVSYTKLSPNHSGQRTHIIDRISPHCVVGQCSVETLGSIFAPSSKQASCNYGIGLDGRVGMYVEEKNRSWCTSSKANDQRAVTIECASDLTAPWAFKDVVYEKLVVLCHDICKRNGRTKMVWIADKNKAVNYEPAPDEMQFTVHRWYANKACPGDWLFERMQNLTDRVNALLQQDAPQIEVDDHKDDLVGTQATVLKGMDHSKLISKLGPIFTADQKKSGILASISMAQFILESGWGQSQLTQDANNCFGMKKSLSGNTWAGSTWDGTSVVSYKTKEQNPDGSEYIITAEFRKYSCIEDSIADHSAYLCGAANGSKLRYQDLKGCTDYKTAAQIIKDGGYATDVSYVSKLCSIIESNNLTKYDVGYKAPNARLYRVRKSWADSGSQIGAYSILDNAKKIVDSHPGYYVYDESGNQVYPEVQNSYQLYTVLKGDTLWGIAERFLGAGERYTEIKTLNGSRSDTIYVGQILRIPTGAAAAPEKLWTPAVGDAVNIKSGAVWYTGKTISSWVFGKSWIICSLDGNRAVLGKSTDKLNNIQSPIDTKYLTRA